MRMLLAMLTVSVLGLSGCFSSNPDSIREHAADATAATKRDATAVAQGVFEGLARKGPVNINKASREQLLTLPGVTAGMADAIIARRPYADAAELVRRHIVPKTEYNRIAERITAR